VVQKINSKTQTQQPNVMANNIQKISEKMLEQLVRQKTGYQWTLEKSAPIYLCISLLENIQYVHTVLQCYAEKDREEMLNYFAEWTDTQAGMLENQTLHCLQLSYNHYDISSGLNEIYRSYQTYLQIFQKLAQLEFIGKKKGQGIFVIEQEVRETKPVTQTPTQKPNNRWSPLT
jgi:sulfur relay (sulfurtransferase) DsrC/TusE family protein